MNKRPPPEEQTALNGMTPPPGLFVTRGLSRLIAAAVVDKKFRELLLENPAAALESSYGGETFHLTEEEKALILPIRQASSLADFAMQILKNNHKGQQQSG